MVKIFKLHLMEHTDYAKMLKRLMDFYGSRAIKLYLIKSRRYRL